MKCYIDQKTKWRQQVGITLQKKFQIARAYKFRKDDGKLEMLIHEGICLKRAESKILLQQMRL